MFYPMLLSLTLSMLTLELAIICHVLITFGLSLKICLKLKSQHFYWSPNAVKNAPDVHASLEYRSNCNDPGWSQATRSHIRYVDLDRSNSNDNVRPKLALESRSIFRLLGNLNTMLKQYELHPVDATPNNIISYLINKPSTELQRIQAKIFSKTVKR